MRKLILSGMLAAISVAGFSQALLYDQTAGVTTNGLVSQDFEALYGTYDSRIADDFEVPTGETWYVDSIKAYGFYSTGATVIPEAGINMQIYDDNNGAPGNLLYADTIETNMDANNDGTLNAPLTAPLQLNAGTYWVAFAARKDYVVSGNVAGIWYWRLESSNNGNEALWENLAGGFAAGCTQWTPLTDPSCVAVDHGGVVFRVYGCLGANKPTLDPINDTSFCEGPSVTLNATGTGSNLAYIWNNGATTQSITTDTSGYFAVTVYDTATLCGAKESAIVTVKDIPKYELFDDTICPEVLPYTLFASPQNAIVTWFDNTTGLTTQVNGGGTYWATYSGFNGCDGGDTMTLVVQTQSPPTFLPSSTIDLCEGDDVTVSTTTSYVTYSWGNANDTNTVLANTDTFLIDNGGTYWLDAIASNGCSTSGQFTVVDRPLPQPTINQGFNSNTLNIKLGVAEDYESYGWSTGDSTKNMTVDENGTYTVIVIDEYGCEGTATVDVSTVGVEDPVASKFGFYPNPTQGVIQFSWPNWTEESSLTVVDVRGSIVATLKSSNGINQIDLSNYDAGVYFIKIQSPEGEGNARVVKR